MSEARRPAFEAAYTTWLLEQLVKEQNIPIFFERSSVTGHYYSLQVESAWWGWINSTPEESAEVEGN